MRIDPTPEQIEAFRRDGFVVIENVLDAGELETWRATVGDAVRERIELQNGLNNQFDGGDPFYAAVFTQALRLGDTHAGLRPLVRAPELGKLAGDLIGADAMRIWHDQALIKEPHGNQTTWHRDTPYWAFHTRTAVNFWIALDDATLANGCLWYLPGTHLMGDYDLVKIGRNMTDIFKAYPEWAAIEPVAAPCPAGSIVIHNSMVVHGAGPNMTTRRRRAMTIAYFPDGTLYNGTPDTLPPAYSRTLTTGDALDDDRYVPLAWSRDGRTARPAAVSETAARLSFAEVLSAVRTHAARKPTEAKFRLDFGADGSVTWAGAEVTSNDSPAADLTVTTDLDTWSELVAGTLDWVMKPVPEPGPGQLLLRVGANALCGTDRMQWRFGAGDVTPGHDAAGEVVATGSGTTTAVGTRGTVYLMEFCGTCRSCSGGHTNVCYAKGRDFGFTADGGYAPYELIAERCLFPIGDALNLDEATMLLDVQRFRSRLRADVR